MQEVFGRTIGGLYRMSVILTLFGQRCPEYPTVSGIYFITGPLPAFWVSSVLFLRQMSYLDETNPTRYRKLNLTP